MALAGGGESVAASVKDPNSARQNRVQATSTVSCGSLKSGSSSYICIPAGRLSSLYFKSGERPMVPWLSLDCFLVVSWPREGALLSGYRVSSGLPNSDGIRSSRNNSTCALPPTARPASLFIGTIASTAICQVPET